MTGTLTLGGNPPLVVPAGATSGYILVSDGSGNFTPGPNTGSSSGITLTPTAIKTSAYTAAAGDYVICDTQTTGAWTLTLPNAPAGGTVVAAKLVKQAGTNAVTIVRNPSGTDVFNVSGTSLTLSLLNQGVLLQYKTSGGIWYVVADDLALSQLDARYTQLAGDLGNTTATPHVTGIQGSAVAAPSGGPTYYLNASGAWTVPAGSGGASLDTTDLPLALAATALHGTGSNGASCSDHVHPTTGVALLAGAAFTGAVSTTGNLSASGTFAVTGNATASGTLAVSKALTSGVVTLTDASTIAVNAALGGTFRVTLSASGHTMGAPSNPADGQMILFEITQGASAYTLAWASGSGGYLFPPGLPAPTITTTASYTDCVGFKYRSSSNVWRCMAIEQGYSS
jgi:hypothetical protein